LLLIFTTNCINVQWNVLYMVKVLDWNFKIVFCCSSNFT
jgi:hypothetical protein